jgi:predicted Zn-dependent protease
VYDGDYTRADGILRDLIREGPPRAIGWQLGLLSTSLRAQGRLDEALRTTQRLRVLGQNGNPASPISRDAQLTAQILLESGHPRASAAIWDSLMVLVRNLKPPYTRGLDARGITWFLAHRAVARAAAGDTVGLEPLADSIEVIGRRSLYGRDRVIHHHVRGLLAVARGNLPEAAAQFRAAIYSPTLGFTRTNLDLARTLIALHQPSKAVGVLQSALRGVLDASNSYVSRTELHEALAQAFDQVGQPDSAAAEYRLVVSAWGAADPPFRPRLAAAKLRLIALAR